MGIFGLSQISSKFGNNYLRVMNCRTWLPFTRSLWKKLFRKI